jgi:outer membrane protein, heavy metal efflux system
MSLAHIVTFCALLAMTAVGCRTGPSWWSSSASSPSADVQSSGNYSSGNHLPTAPVLLSGVPLPQNSVQGPAAGACFDGGVVAAASFGQPAIEEIAEPRCLPPVELQAEFSLPEFLAEVQAQNPTLEAMTMAWRAAGEKYPQAIALDDPMLMATTAPDSLGHSSAESAYAFQLDQKFPWCGKRAAKGRQARAETDAAHGDLEDSRRQLIETAQNAFYDYYLVRQELELNRENDSVLGQFRETAISKYRTSQVTQQDVLQADVEVAQLERERLELTRMDRVAVARINTLLRQPPYTPLPPPPRQLAAPLPPGDVCELQQIAVGQRPDLATLAAKVRATEAQLALARKDFYPDVDLFGRYDTFWLPANSLVGQVGVNVNLPIYYGRLNAAVREAADEVAQRRAEYEQRLIDVQFEVANAYEETAESQRAVELYSSKLIPASEQNLDAAHSNYDVGKGSFLDLAVAQRQSIEMRRKQQETLTEYHKRVAALARAIGGGMPTAPSMEKVPTPMPQ